MDMRKSALLLLCVPLALAACGPQAPKAPGAHNLTGTLSGNWGTGSDIRLALVGGGFPSVIKNDGGRPQRLESAGVNTWTFGIDLPKIPDAVGVYQVVAFEDINGSAGLDANEVSTSARNQQWLIYSLKGGEFSATSWTPAMNVAEGWNVYDQRFPLGAANPRPGPDKQNITGYDLSR